MKYGREITEVIYYGGEVSSTKFSVEESVAVDTDKLALAEVLKALGMVRDKKTARLTIEVFANPNTYKFERVVTRSEKRTKQE